MMLEYARIFNGTPYQWGGDNPLTGFDCSGFVQWVLRSEGFDPPGRQNAQALYSLYSKIGIVLEKPEPGAIVFFGRNNMNIGHVGLALTDKRMIHAASGDCSTLDFSVAKKQGACVREDLITYRKDFLIAIIPKYNIDIKN